MLLESMMKWRVKKENYYELEEYRKTLEVLDNVLAEFDDWPAMETEDKNFNNENNSLDVFSTDNHSNQNSSDFQKENPLAIPNTQLSEDNNNLLSHKITSPPGTRNHPQLTSVSFVVQESNMAMWATESDDGRMQQLRSKFHRVRELLKRNVITLLDAEPPSFIPPNPPSPNKNFTFSCDISELSDSSSNSRQSPTVEDIPNLLPTDVLLRPQFGITYSLEEDLPPGVKEIHRTSTPKSNVSPTSSFSREFGRLSTFNSQSEWEVASSIPDKVPVTSFKSLTLPNGLDRFPFSTQEESSHWRKPSTRKSTNNVSPREEERETKKSHFSFRKFSRKSKSGSVL
ncbi:uncharacterized protein [Parasteatoda tepidariorum]|uniref:uncharacterized protein isoform X2 n=1 Tax=Parasteatoda tepidariorum TaxID=114398 RepID=UPI001C71E1B2|nr:uncharacterized protein LOC107443053 isoform X2 [Parasteatoda tepidariorum]